MKHILNVMSLMSTLHAYSLQTVVINQRCSEFEYCRRTYIQNFMSTHKKRNLRKYSAVFLKHFPKNKLFGGPYIYNFWIIFFFNNHILFLLIF